VRSQTLLHKKLRHGEGKSGGLFHVCIHPNILDEGRKYNVVAVGCYQAEDQQKNDEQLL
jgi:hypothetical protein